MNIKPNDIWDCDRAFRKSSSKTNPGAKDDLLGKARPKPGMQNSTQRISPFVPVSYNTLLNLGYAILSERYSESMDNPHGSKYEIVASNMQLNEYQKKTLYLSILNSCPAHIKIYKRDRVEGNKCAIVLRNVRTGEIVSSRVIDVKL